jgi:hypothetical protein
VLGGGNGIMSDIWTLVLDHFVDEVRFRVVFFFFGWMTSTGLTYLTINTFPGCAVVLLDGIRVNPFTIISVVNAQPGLSKKT